MAGLRQGGRSAPGCSGGTMRSPRPATISSRSRASRRAWASGEWARKAERISECEKAGVPLDDFIELALAAMKGISDDLGL